MAKQPKANSPFSKIAEQFAVRQETPSIKVSPDVFNELWGRSTSRISV